MHYVEYEPCRKFPEYSGNAELCASLYNTDFIIISKAIRPYYNTFAKKKRFNGNTKLQVALYFTIISLNIFITVPMYYKRKH